jgi:NAD(P)-dependent dehydrogenase (short-subunit alcohol dehydrogenase family)
MAGLLNGKVAIITGAGGGLGEAYARLFAREGASVVVNDLGGSRDGTGGSSAAAAKVVADIVAAGGRAVANGDNVATKEGGENILKTALDSFGQVDIVVANAGILRDKSFAKMSEADWDAVLQVHLKGTYYSTLPVWHWLRDNSRPGVIIMTSSTSGLYGKFGQANYGAAKAGIYGFMRVLALEGARAGIRVMAVAPAALTRMTSDLPGVQDGEPDPMSLPENIAPTVLYMASDLAADHSGKVLLASPYGVAEMKMLQVEGFKPTGPYTAEDVAANADKVFFPADWERVAKLP